MTLRLGTPAEPRGVAHIAVFCGSDAQWRSQCWRIRTAAPVPRDDPDHGERQWRELPTWRYSGGRLVLLEWETPTVVPVCSTCIDMVEADYRRFRDWLRFR